MKKALSLITLLLAVFNLSAQKKIIFNINYLPNNNYAVSTKMDMNMTMDFKGDTAQIKAMKGSGVKMPMVMIMNYDMQIGVKAGKKDAKNEYPVVMTYDKMDITGTMNGEKIPIPATPLNGAKIYARYDASGGIKIDSMPGKILDEPTKQAVINSITELQGQFKFPAEGIAVGQTFKQDVPMSMPVAGKNMEMLINTAYKLNNIVNDIAYFDVDQSLTMEVPMNNGASMKMKGGGKGKMEYSLKTRFINIYSSDFNFGYTMDVNKVVMEGNADMKFVYTVNVN
ncbi:hypothetical protein DJ568_09545 [Mucilaginibacter hurinus]|uniref:Uncharacterized protein n=1 Tax=Mucilaginibacter hurinus TaxID=2201324 RepID=A0A367GMM6_9SPHI|nr:hypothetical protein [Mucilaginibacter hurinus]RCH54724.1 hypothetical protein DJ568_09545 [Mucilaginibacter hurinus]